MSSRPARNPIARARSPAHVGRPRWSSTTRSCLPARSAPEDRADEVPALAVHPRRAHHEVPRPRQHRPLARQLRAPVCAERPGRVVLAVLAVGIAREHVVGREVDDPGAGGRDVLRPRRRSQPARGRGRARSRRRRSSPRRGRRDRRPERLAHRAGVGHVELRAGRERRTGQVVAQREPDLAARARYENVGISSQSSPGSSRRARSRPARRRSATGSRASGRSRPRRARRSGRTRP